MHTLDGVLELRAPTRAALPVVVDSPHSGEISPPDFGHSISRERLRMTVDAYVDELFEAAPAYGATFLRALFPRTYIDPNRSLHDIDRHMLDEEWPHPIAPSPKVNQGIGLVASRDLYGQIYRRSLSVQEVKNRIAKYYAPYHGALQAALDESFDRFGAVWHLNCHSMRTHTGPKARPGSPGLDMCVGDRDGQTAGPEVRELVVETLRELGYRVTVNQPYKGVELVGRYGAPTTGRHSVQLEISRELYMDESSVEKHDGFAKLRADLNRLMEVFCSYAGRQTGARLDVANAAE